MTSATETREPPGIKQQIIAWRLRGYLIFALLLTALCAGAWFERAVLLRGAADLWIVSDPITPADAAVVLGGGIDTRPFAAADLYSRGLVRKILVSKVLSGRSVKIGAVSGHTENNVMVLRKLGVPDDGIELFGNQNGSTLEEAIALKNWAKQHAASVLIIPAEPFFTRRVHWLFQREFSGTGIRIEVLSFDPSGNNRSEWWYSNEGIIAFQNEVLKYIYYRWKY